MSDYNPFGAAPESSDVVEEPARDRRRTVVALGALAAVVLGAGGFLLLGGGSDEELDAAVPAASAPAPAAAPTAAPVTTLPVATDYTLGRNPFRALYVQPAAAAEPAKAQPAPAQPAPTATTGTTLPATGGTSLPTTGGTSVPTTGGTGTGGVISAPTAKEYKLILVRVFGEGTDLSASFSIDGVEQVAKVGSTFGMHMEILLLELTEAPTGEWTATLQVGDGDPFDVKTGEPAYVR